MELLNTLSEVQPVTKKAKDRGQGIHELLKDKRDDLGLSQQATADRIGVTLSTYRRWELGGSVPVPEKRPSVASWLGLREPVFHDLCRQVQTDRGKTVKNVTRADVQKLRMEVEDLSALSSQLLSAVAALTERLGVEDGPAHEALRLVKPPADPE